MKYDSTFYRAINQSPARFQKFIDSMLVEKYKTTAWKDSFAWDIAPSVDGVFSQLEIVSGLAAMADGRAKWSETSKRDTSGVASFMGTTFNFGVGMEETGEDIEKINKIAKNWGGDKDVIGQFVMKFETLLDNVHNRISNMAFQMESGASINVSPSHYGVGYQMNQLPLVATNKIKTLAGDWATVASATPITDMLAGEKQADTIGMTANRVWRLPKALQSAFLANEEVKSYIKMFLYPTSTNVVSTMAFSSKDLEAFLSSYGEISPIQWVDAKQKAYARDGSITDTNPWVTGAAVLRPAGLAGVVKYDELPELTIQSGQPGIITASAENGRIGIIRKFDNMKPLWTTDVITSCVPVLNNWTKYIILDTTQK